MGVGHKVNCLIPEKNFVTKTPTIHSTAEDLTVLNCVHTTSSSSAGETALSDPMISNWETASGPARLKILSTKRTLKIGSWNIRTLYQAGKLTNVVNEMIRYKLDILGLSEVRWDNAGEHKLQTGQKLLYSGVQTQTPTHTHGVGLLISKQAQSSLISWTPHGPRILEATFKTQHKKIKLKIIVGYAPINDASDEDKDNYYDQLEHICNKNKSSKELVMLIGDFNAKVGSENEGIECNMGKEGMGTKNENGDRLIDFCVRQDFVIGGTVFPHKDIHKATWISPDGRTTNQIDHVCISKKFRRSLMDVKVMRGADADTDHYLVTAKIKLKLKKMDKPKDQRIKFDTRKLKEEHIKAEFKLTLQNRFNALQTDELDDQEDINVTWTKIKNVFNNTSKDILGIKRQEIKPWISNLSLSLIEDRRKIKDKLLNSNLNDQEGLKEDYRDYNKKIKKSIRKDKRLYTENLANEAEEAMRKNNLKDLYQLTNKLSGKGNKANSNHIKDKHGNIIDNDVDTEARWVEHFSGLFNRPAPVNPAEINPAETILDINCNAPSLAEIKAAIRSLKLNKSAGPDNITAEILKADINLSAENLSPFITKVWENETFPDDWKNGFITVLPKKGDLSDCDNHRGIMLLSIPGKIVSKIILNRMKETVDKLLRNNQAGFRSNKSCTDQISSLRIILEQSTEFNTPLYINFIDYSKAFDSIDRDSLWKIMAHYGIPTKLINLIKKMYDSSGGQVLFKGKLSSFFEIMTGVRQGCLLSPFLFLLVIDWIMKQSVNESTGIQWTLTKKLDDLDFADDIALLANKQTHMQDKTNNITENSAKVGLHLNVKKTKVMKINTNNNTPIQVGNEVIENVEKFTYLGSVVTPNGGTEADVHSRINKARASFAQLSKVWSSTNIKIKTKLQIFNSNVKSVLLYGSETWFLTKKLEDKLQVFLNKCLKRIFKIFWPNIIRNEDLWKRAGQDKISNQIKQKKFRWLGHTLRKDQDDITRISLKWNPQGQRNRGRPKLTWRRQLSKEIQEMGLTNVDTLAQDRRQWRRMVGGLCSTQRNEEG